MKDLKKEELIYRGDNINIKKIIKETYQKGKDYYNKTEKKQIKKENV